jgi:adenosylcobinamide kinase / adenosylcobinamide-phosphate guanylyltransferase
MRHKIDLRKEPLMNKIILVGGGARSGKSRFALSYAQALGARRLFVATAEARDSEMSERIARHRDERGDEFATKEEPVDLARLLAEDHAVDVFLVDCLTLWLSNLLLREHTPSDIEKQVQEVLATIESRRQHVIVVSNEVGLGIVPESALARSFRDIVGRAHQQIAAVADEVYLAAMGMVVRLVPEPLKPFRPGQVP